MAVSLGLFSGQIAETTFIDDIFIDDYHNMLDLDQCIEIMIHTLMVLFHRPCTMINSLPLLVCTSLLSHIMSRLAFLLLGGNEYKLMVLSQRPCRLINVKTFDRGILHVSG